MRRILCLLACAVMLVSAGACSRGVGYAEESVTREHYAESDIAHELCEMMRMLTVNSPIMPEFEGIGEAMEQCRDSVLYYMLTKNYGKYTGDIDRLDAAVAEYPQMQIMSLIPAREFEETVYTAFGGTRKISNESGRLFVYLDRIAAYTSVTMLDADPIEVDVISLGETENTYRMRCRCSADEVTSPEYQVIFIKRDDGTVYFHSVDEIG